MAYKVSFNNSNRVFFNTLKTAVDEYFEKNNLRKTGNYKLYVKTTTLIVSTLAIYLSVLFLPMPGWVAILLSAGFGLCMAFIGFNVMHDANHGSFSLMALTSLLSVIALKSLSKGWNRDHSLRRPGNKSYKVEASLHTSPAPHALVASQGLAKLSTKAPLTTTDTKVKSEFDGHVFMATPRPRSRVALFGLSSNLQPPGLARSV
jgi:hypothetical protein